MSKMATSHFTHLHAAVVKVEEKTYSEKMNSDNIINIFYMFNYENIF